MLTPDKIITSIRVQFLVSWHLGFRSGIRREVKLACFAPRDFISRAIPFPFHVLSSGLLSDAIIRLTRRIGTNECVDGDCADRWYHRHSRR